MLVTISRGGSASAEPLEQLQPLAEAFVDAAAWSRGLDSQAGNTPRLDRREERQVVAERIDVVAVSDDHHQRAGRMSRQRGRHEREARAPDSAQGGSVPCGQAGQDLGKARLSFKTRDQVQQSVRRPG